MGLDMFFIFTTEDNKPDFDEIIQKNEYFESSDKNIYWRNKDVIHCWLEDHLALEKYPSGQMDNCNWYYFPEQTIYKLYDACQNVLSHPDDAKTIIPPSKPYDFCRILFIDDYYFEAISDTVYQLTKNLSNPSMEHGGWYTFWW